MIPQFFYKNNRYTLPLEEMIKNVNTLEEFEEMFPDEFLDEDTQIGSYLESLLWKYDKDNATVSRDACLDKSYVGNIVRGKKNNPGRDALISICLAIGTTVEEVQYLLKYAGHSPLYARRKRDVIIWFGFMKHKAFNDVNTDLHNRGFKPLTKCY